MTESDPLPETAAHKPSRGIYLLPNLFTTAGLFSGFYAIVAAIGGRYEAAAVAIFVGMIMDGIDGRVARLTHTQSQFGVEYDSLSDMVCFGLAPALVMYQWALHGFVDYGWLWAKLGWLAAFVYVAGGALRLARFNSQVETADKRYFQGLPSPSAAAVLAGLVWWASDGGLEAEALRIPVAVVTVIVGILMVSNFRYYSFKEIDYKNRVPFVVLLLVVLGFILVLIDPPTLLFFGFSLYALSGPILTLWLLRRKRRERTRSDSHS